VRCLTLPNYTTGRADKATITFQFFPSTEKNTNASASTSTSILNIENLLQLLQVNEGFKQHDRSCLSVICLPLSVNSTPGPVLSPAPFQRPTHKVTSPHNTNNELSPSTTISGVGPHRIIRQTPQPLPGAKSLLDGYLEDDTANCRQQPLATSCLERHSSQTYRLRPRGISPESAVLFEVLMMMLLSLSFQPRDHLLRSISWHNQVLLIFFFPIQYAGVTQH